MRVVCLLVLVALMAHAEPVSSQSWRVAYEAGDFSTAARMLQPIVVSAILLPAVDDDPAPARTLATLYAEGLGVDRDPVVACALAQHSRMAAEMAAPRYAEAIFAFEALRKAGDRFVAEQCQPLSDAERSAAIQSIGCYAFGLSEQFLTIGPHMVRLDRQGVALVGAKATAMSLECPVLYGGARTYAVEPPRDALPGVRTRYFADVLTWHFHLNPQNGSPLYRLRWLLVEVSSKGVGPQAIDVATTVSSWPQTPLPSELEPKVSLRMIRTGHVRWRVEGAPPRRGWIMQPENSSR